MNKNEMAKTLIENTAEIMNAFNCAIEKAFEIALEESCAGHGSIALAKRMLNI